MQPNDLPLVCLPIGLNDEAAAQVLEFLHAFTEAFEQYYAGQLHESAWNRINSYTVCNRRELPPPEQQHDLKIQYWRGSSTIL